MIERRPWVGLAGAEGCEPASEWTKPGLSHRPVRLSWSDRLTVPVLGASSEPLGLSSRVLQLAGIRGPGQRADFLKEPGVPSVQMETGLQGAGHTRPRCFLCLFRRLSFFWFLCRSHHITSPCDVAHLLWGLAEGGWKVPPILCAPAHRLRGTFWGSESSVVPVLAAQVLSLTS